MVDFTDWIADGTLEESRRPLTLATVKKSEADLPSKEKRNVLKAMDFVKNAGYPSEAEAIHIIRDGNINHMLHEVVEIIEEFRKIPNWNFIKVCKVVIPKNPKNREIPKNPKTGDSNFLVRPRRNFNVPHRYKLKGFLYPPELQVTRLNYE